MNEYFLLLGLEPGATHEEIKKAFRQKIKLCHPDSSSGEAEKARLLIEAYNYLIDNQDIYPDLESAAPGSKAGYEPEQNYDSARESGERIFKGVFRDRPPAQKMHRRPPVEDVYDPLVFLRKRSQSALPLDKGEMFFYRAEMALRDVVAQYNRQKKHRSKRAWSREYTGKLVTVQVLFRDVIVRFPGLSVQARARLKQIDELISEIKQMI